MPKSREELNELKKRYENLTEEIRELSEEELAQVSGGDLSGITMRDIGLRRELRERPAL